VGLGYISQVAVLPAFAHARRNSVLAAIVSGDAQKRDALARRYRVPTSCSYDDFDRLLSSGEIDAVYVATPNHLHAEQTIQAARHGVHVLCEKPMAVTEQECRDMIEACDRGRVKLMIAYRLHFEAASLAALELARSRQLGDLRFFSSSFCMQVKEGNIRLQRETGGGTLYDIGIYCINAARTLFGDEPLEVYAAAVAGRESRFEEVDEMTAAILRFPDQRLASFVCSFGASDVSSYRLVGTEGSLCMDPAYELAEGLEMEVSRNGKSKRRKFAQRDQFGPELLYFSDCIQQNKEPEPGGLEGLIDVRIIRALYESARIGEPLRLRPIGGDRRPDPSQRIDRPAVRKPDLVHAEAPSR
jgi:glucose-fructose oxidoreductase